ncbi:hypothetical protein L596_014460 [Steinernema carpocapsae]|uniref:Peptidase M13 C-terminal domain-containing protein n=1 Tax=Steinernema carpocapsae TaxID=34508 RepID=A0A4U5NC83_STECR|nr:hypothetical protein L596_014460 [Steinernema carpocapsae]
MADLLGKVSAFLLILTLAVAIASLVLSGIILGKVNKPAPAPPALAPAPKSPCDNGHFTVKETDDYKHLARTLYDALDESVDPCDDFYKFTCGGFLRNTDITNGNRIGTYDQSQQQVNTQIYDALKSVTNVSSKTERISKIIVESCIANAHKKTTDKSKDVNDFINQLFKGFPALNSKWTPMSLDDFWYSVGLLEGVHNVPSIFQAQVTVDQRKIHQNALYINQGGLPLPRDYYVKPSFLANLESYLNEEVTPLIGNFSMDTLNKMAAKREDLERLVQFEIELATAMLPDDLLRNYRQQYNGYTAADLKTAYTNINWEKYFLGLGIPTTNQTMDHFIVAQPSYIATVNSLFAQGGELYDGQKFDFKTAVNFVILRLLQDSSGYIGGLYQKTHQHFLSRYAQKTTYDDTVVSCVNEAANYMVYGPGYVYIKSIGEDRRNAVQQNISTQTDLVVNAFLDMVDTLEWMTNSTKEAAHTKAHGLKRNIGWPKWFNFTDETVQDNYNYRYNDILDIVNSSDNYWTVLQTLKNAQQLTENIGILGKPADRLNFLSSPSTVNAWYQPERNSITFPYAAFNPPYFKMEYPQAYNFAGQGGTGGHELTHGYDDEGVQFGPNGTLGAGNCSWDYCGWMDKESRQGFQDMAQCVISQYSSTCCPVKTGSVHCANGATTQGENIADLGGQLAAYNAYQNWKKTMNNGVEEARLPQPMVHYTPNQIFWITYGHSWCMKQTTESLVNQLLTNPHSPGSCRTNQVVQDIPAFGQDFNCPKGSKMYPTPAQNVRCKVWTGF